MKQHPAVAGLDDIFSNSESESESDSQSQPERLFLADEALKARDLEWIVQGLVPAQSFLLLGGLPKSKKSLIALEMAVSVAAGTPFLGMQTQPMPVIYSFLEDHIELVRRRARALRVHDRLKGLAKAMLTGYVGLEGFEHAFEQARQQRCLWIVDTMGEAIASRGLDENKMADMLNFLRPYRDAIRAANAVGLFITHMRKAGDSIRGSGALTATVDGWFEVHAETSSNEVVKLQWRLREGEAGRLGVRISAHGNEFVYSQAELAPDEKVNGRKNGNSKPSEDNLHADEHVMAVIFEADETGVSANDLIYQLELTKGIRPAKARISIDRVQQACYAMIKGGKLYMTPKYREMRLAREPETNTEQ